MNCGGGKLDRAERVGGGSGIVPDASSGWRIKPTPARCHRQEINAVDRVACRDRALLALPDGRVVINDRRGTEGFHRGSCCDLRRRERTESNHRRSPEHQRDGEAGKRRVSHRTGLAGSDVALVMNG